MANEECIKVDPILSSGVDSVHQINKF